MTPLRIEDGLLLATLSVTYQGRQVELTNALVDTGSASTILSATVAEQLEIKSSADSELRRIRGVGGVEFVYTTTVSRIAIGKLVANDMIIEVGAMEYGIALDAIVGLDFLTQTRAILDMGRLLIRAMR